METTADTTKIHDFYLRVVSNGYVVTFSNDPCRRGEEYVFGSLTSLLDWLRVKLPMFLSADEKAMASLGAL